MKKYQHPTADVMMFEATDFVLYSDENDIDPGQLPGGVEDVLRNEDLNIRDI